MTTGQRWDNSPRLKFKLEQDGSTRNRFKLTTNDPYWWNRMEEFEIPEQWRINDHRVYMLGRRNVKFQKYTKPTPTQIARMERRRERQKARHDSSEE